MMKQSTIPEISELAKAHLVSEDYWNDLSDIEHLLKEEKYDFYAKNVNSENKEKNAASVNKRIPKICLSLSDNVVSGDGTINKNLLETSKSEMKSLISPSFSYFDKFIMPLSPSTFFSENETNNEFQKLIDNDTISVPKIFKHSSKKKEDFILSPLALKRYISISLYINNYL